MEDFKDLIKQEDYNKYNELLHKFECKAIDLLEDLTYQFKENLAEEIDDKIKGWKKDSEKLSRENFVQKERIAELEQELAELKEKAIVLPKNLQVGNKVFWANEDGLFIGEIKTISQDTAVWFYVVYDNGLTYWHLLKDFNNEVFATKQEAQAKLKEIKENE